MRNWIPQGAVWIVVAPLICFGVAWAVSFTPPFERFEWRTLDWRTQVRAALGQPGPDPRIMIIGIGDRSVKNIEPWPFRRAYHAQLQNLLAYAEPAVVTWDVLYFNRVDFEGKPLDGVSDEDLAATTSMLAAKGIPVVFAAVSGPDPTGDEAGEFGATRPLTAIEGDRSRLLGDDFIELPFPGIREQGFFGTVDAPRGAGGIVRKMPMLVRVGEWVLPSLSLQAAMRYWEVAEDGIRVVLGDGVYLETREGAKRIPIDSHGLLTINYRYEPMQPDDPLGVEFPTVEYFDLLIDLHQKHVVKSPAAKPPVDLQDRIVLIGEFSTDSGPTPRSDNSPLVYQHANVLHNIIASDYVIRANRAAEWGLAILVGVLGAWITRRYSIRLAVAFTGVTTAGFVWFCFSAWIESSLWVELVGPVMGFLLLQFWVLVNRALNEQKSKAEMRGMFGSYLSPVVVEKMVNSGEQPALGGVNEEITAYFSDIQNFSSFSEVLSAPQLVELLNEYLTACTDIIHESGGTLDKYIGDAVVAMFGAPVDLEDHAYQACLTVLRMQQRLAELREKWIGEGDKWPPLVHQMRTRIGLNTGSCMIGNMGSRTRFNYTMMGDHVNLAARMESGAKSWGVYNLVTESTRIACEARGGDRIVFRPLGKIVVAGRSQPVPIHEVVGLKEELSAETFACLERFDAGLNRYWARDWNGALEEFVASAALETLQPGRDPGVHTNASEVYQRLVRHMMSHPPPEAWDGTYVMGQK